jgi:hypothetical protein
MRPETPFMMMPISRTFAMVFPFCRSFEKSSRTRGR